MSPSLYLGAMGFGLIAVCYGFARFAFGLFLPQIDADLSLSPTLSGLISGGSFLGYCIAIVLSAFLTERVGARAVAVGAALVAAIGMIGIATAPSPLLLASAVMLAGSSTGLASPPMAAAVAAAVRADRQSATNTIINAGTSAGVVRSGPVALMMGGQWRLAFAGFGVAAFVMAIAAAYSVPSRTKTATTTAASFPPLTSDIVRLIVASFLMGASSTALWSFGGQLVTLQLGWSSTGAGLLWIAIGAAGIVGASAGTLVARFGIDYVHWLFLGGLAAGILLVGTSATTPLLAIAGGMLFGAAYIMLTGVYLVWGVSALPDRPATGLMIGFLTIAIGQTAGAPLFGLLMDRLPPDYAVIVFACLTFTAGLARAGNAQSSDLAPKS
ncbi:MFS transporter [Halomonas sp. QX-2]|mgnify:CR=1 FL=1|uniref:MFS transporter n=1 Tax=Vreelandella sedimenti TaxID=2729618 RepID=A0A7Z0N9S0_9GAMM|nr:MULTISPECIES: MFS transporter [Halomonas]NYT73561.1 MFS transporter [Halomonas sedimenti]|tara:strand:+ start:38758 stop:39909 length:1152 start_codon:yes stop_codon:yes gene_type:complete